MRDRRAQRGFTLLEMLVAVGVTAALLLFAAPHVPSVIGAMSLKGASRATVQYVRLVRAAAINKNCNSRLVVSADGTTLTTQVDRTGAWATSGQPLVLPGAATVASILPSTSAATFTAQGTTSGSVTMVLQNSRGDRRNLVISPLGAVDAP